MRPYPGQDGVYQIVAGERRWRASQKAQLHQVPVIVREFDDIEGDSPDRGTLDLDDILVEQSMKKKGSLDQNGMKRVRGSNNRAKYSK